MNGRRISGDRGNSRASEAEPEVGSSMTITIELPDELASRLAQLPEEERSRFSIVAIADTLTLRDEEQNVVEVVGRALADMDEGRGLVSFGEVCRQWDSEKAIHKTQAHQIETLD